jgi:hypothetical protein
VLLANSGGPLIIVALGIVAWMLWSVRRRMFAVRWAIVGILVLLAVVMKAPLWYLPHKLSAFSGGAGWHRSYLMDKVIENIDQWWLAGMPLDWTTHWFPYLAMGAVDITNTYVVFGLDGGLMAIALFTLLLVRAFKGLGRALATVRPSGRIHGQAEYVLWGLGAVLVGHLGNFFGITYWDQMYVVWFMHLASVSSVSQACAEQKVEAAREVAPEVARAWWSPRVGGEPGVLGRVT